MKKNDSYTQPLALIPLFTTEMWERYGFYVIQSLLALFLSIHMGLSNSATYTIVGTFTALSYIMPVMGGLIADRLIGQKLSVIFGCICLFCSYLFLAMSYGEIESLYVALSGVAVGTGLLKPNIACIVGTLYKAGDSRRDGGFSIYYAGMALGILIGTTVPYNLQETFGWRVTFLTPVFALALALFIFYFGVKKFKLNDNVRMKRNSAKIILAVFLAMTSWVFSFVLLDFPFVALVFFISLALVSVIAVSIIALKEDKVQRAKTFSFLILCFISVLFWMLYFQVFLSLTLFIFHCVKPDIPHQNSYFCDSLKVADFIS